MDPDPGGRHGLPARLPGNRLPFFYPVLWIRDLLVQIPDPRIRASDQWIRIRILLFSSLTFKTPTLLYFLKVHYLNQFLNIKSHKEVTKQ